MAKLARFPLIIGLLMPIAVCAAFNEETPNLKSVGFENVTLEGGFWGPKLKMHRKALLPHALDMLESRAAGGHSNAQREREV